MDRLIQYLDAVRERVEKARFGPWRWYFNVRNKLAMLATEKGGRVFVMLFKRWGMRDAQPEFQVDERMVPAHTLGVPDHNGDVEIQHPDADFIAAARTDVEVLERMLREAVEALAKRAGGPMLTPEDDTLARIEAMVPKEPKP